MQRSAAQCEEAREVGEASQGRFGSRSERSRTQTWGKTQKKLKKIARHSHCRVNSQPRSDVVRQKNAGALFVPGSQSRVRFDATRVQKSAWWRLLISNQGTGHCSCPQAQPPLTLLPHPIPPPVHGASQVLRIVGLGLEQTDLHTSAGKKSKAASSP